MSLLAALVVLVLAPPSVTVLLPPSEPDAASEPTREAEDEPTNTEPTNTEPTDTEPTNTEDTEPSLPTEPDEQTPAPDEPPAPASIPPASIPRPVGPPLVPTEPLPPPRLTTPIHPLQVRWGITAPVVTTSLLGFALMETLGGHRAPPTVCTPPVDGSCPDLGPLEPIDRVALGHYDDAAAKASDALLYLSVAGGLAVGLAESIAWARAEGERGVAHHRRRGAARFGISTAIWAESVGVAMLTTNVLKDAVGRPRPLAHLGEPALLAEGVESDGDLGRSFPSGHATLSFSSTVAAAMLLTLEQCRPREGRRRRCGPRSRREKIVLGLTWGLAMAMATTTSTLRVVAGKHYPTDVLMGAAVGAASGVVIPLLHDRRW
ncbi:MAG: phosphatase PAP2 family protein [Myxococcales bacterium]|nr:phosphatase PAP2 family protein [Myxococcales bacterium]MCB9714094.1 phosphatase PAP2 family protein [Myxococcales bacterium]